MEPTFLTAVHINKVRHLVDIHIPLSSNTRKHLILTGKNGSGKTSVLDSLESHLNYIISQSFTPKAFIDEDIENNTRTLQGNGYFGKLAKRNLATAQKQLESWTDGTITDCVSFFDLQRKYNEGQFILAYYGDKRNIEVLISKTIEKVDLKQVYGIKASPSRELVKYMVNLKATQAFSKNQSRIQEIESWFDRFQNILRMIYDDNSLHLEFNEENFQFSIHIDGREPFDFNTMSMGYAAVFDIIGDLIMRMETKSKGDYDLEGVILIDEIESHLHVDLQKKIVPFLTGLFPNLQFIMTTHSPFVLNSAQNSVIYDLENKTLVENGLTNLPYEGIVEGYFAVDRLSQELRKKFDRYRQLAQKAELSDAEYAEAAELELYLDEIPDYLAIDLSTEYIRLKTELENRG